MKNKTAAVCRSFLWCFIILLFPILSGTLSAILSLNTTETLLLQGLFMVIALILPVGLVFSGKWNWSEIGFAPFDVQGYKKALFFIPLFIIFVPAAIRGFHIQSVEYVLGNLFLYLFVGISEEVYFRGIIPTCLKDGFSDKWIVLWSTIVFAIGHMATALSGSSLLEVALSVLNAFLFGWMAIEMTRLAANIAPAIFVHFLFDFETKIVVLQGYELLIAESVRGALMFIAAIWLFTCNRKKGEKF